jgi:hypothetical protein
MKYLKIFESFRDDYNRIMDDLEKLKKSIKLEVDIYMSDIIDDYQINNTRDYIELKGGNYNIFYDKIKFSYLQMGDFINISQSIFNTIERELGSDILISTSLYETDKFVGNAYNGPYVGGIEHGQYITLNDFIKYSKNIKTNWTMISSIRVFDNGI